MTGCDVPVIVRLPEDLQRLICEQALLGEATTEEFILRAVRKEIETRALEPGKARKPLPPKPE